MENKNNKEFIELYNPIHKNISKFCRAISGNTEDAKDLMHDTILNVLESFDKIKDKSNFKAFVFAVASNLHKKKFRRMKFRADFNARELSQIVDISMNPEYITDFKIIYERILLLPEKISETIILFHISDLSLDEIQKIQGGSLSGVKQRLKRGRERLLMNLKSTDEIKLVSLFLTL